MYLHKTKNGHYTPPCCYFSGELEVVECLPQTFSGGMMVSIAREADNVFYTLAGPEIAVATTKAYSTQLIAGYCLAVQFALVRGCISQGRYQDLMRL